MKFLGIDLHSNCFTCCLITEEGKKVKISHQLKPDSLKEFYRFLTPDMYVMVEASTNTFKFVELIRDRVKTVFVANTHKLKLISLVKKKTDKIDAEKLAIYLKMQITSGEELVKPVYIPEQLIQDLRSLFTTYRMFRRHIGAVKNRIHSLLKQNLFPFTKTFIFGKGMREAIMNLPMNDILKYQINFCFQQLEQLESSINELKEQLLIAAAPYHKQIDILTSMKGISVFTAVALIADIAEIERFDNSKHLTSYLRSAPGVDSSNENIRNLRTNKFGRKLSVTLLSQSLNHFRDSNPKLNRWYKKKVLDKPKGIVRMALCRRVFTEIFQMLEKNEYHYYRDMQNHKKKMDAYYRLLKKNRVALEKEEEYKESA